MGLSNEHKIGLIVNPKAGTAVKPDQLAEMLAVDDRTVEVFESSHPVRAAELALAAGARTIVAAGGDGTLSGVASVIAGSDVPLGIIPAGTLNHFAKALNLPMEVEQAIEVIRHGKIKAVDVAEVNGRIFINNSSLGLYPLMVVLRRRQEKLGLSRRVAQLWAATVSLIRMPVLDVALTVDSSRMRRKTPLIFVGNNQYEFEGVNVGERVSLTEGELFVSIINSTARLHFLHLGLLALIGKLKDRGEFAAFSTAEAVVESRRGLVRVSLDGVVVVMKPHMHYRMSPASFRVLTP
jgi:diacylglycerol kinase family enzyme